MDGDHYVECGGHAAAAWPPHSRSVHMADDLPLVLSEAQLDVGRTLQSVSRPNRAAAVADVDRLENPSHIARRILHDL